MWRMQASHFVVHRELGNLYAHAMAIAEPNFGIDFVPTRPSPNSPATCALVSPLLRIGLMRVRKLAQLLLRLQMRPEMEQGDNMVVFEKKQKTNMIQQCRLPWSRLGCEFVRCSSNVF